MNTNTNAMLAVVSADTLITPGEAAAITKYSLRTIRRWRQAGWLHHVGMAHRPRYRLADVLGLMAALGDLDASAPHAK